MHANASHDSSQRHEKTALKQAWGLKINGKFEESLTLLSEVKLALGVPPGQVTESEIDRLLDGPNADVIVDILCLAASLARTGGELNYAEVVMKQLESQVSRRGIKVNGFFPYEKGMTAFARGDFYSALDCFLRCTSLAKDDFENLCGAINTVFCLENLSLCYAKKLDEVLIGIAKLGKERDVSKFTSQIRAFRLRVAFREGRLSEVLEAGNPDADQAHYFRYWLRLLPYHLSHQPLTASEVSEFSEIGHRLEHQPYRLRTLLGWLHPEDLKIHKPSELADRLYLWVWGWLNDPERHPVHRIATLLEKFDPLSKAHRLTAEDSQLLRNALSWLGLFDPICERRLAQYLSAIRTPSFTEYPLLKLEYLVIQYFLALRDRNQGMADDFLKVCEGHPLWKSPELLFKRLVGSVVEKESCPPTLAGLREALRALTIESLPGDSASYLVHLDLRQIKERDSGRILVSESLCLALELLHDRTSVTCEQFVQICFRLRRYEPELHDSKIFNLLARIKKLGGSRLKIRVKSGQVIAEGDWRDFHFVRTRSAPVLLSCLPELSASESYYPAGSPTAPAGQIPPTAWHGGRRPNWEGLLARGDLEKMMRKPRSSTNRILCKWIAEGWVVRKGQGKAARYSIRTSSIRKPVPLSGDNYENH